MLKFIAILCIVYVVHGETTNNIDGYLFAIRQQNSRNIQNMDKQLEGLTQKFDAQVNSIYTNSEQLLNTLGQTVENLKPLQVISAASKRCVDKYIKILPNAANTQYAINKCASDASYQKDTLFYYPSYYRKLLNSYYQNTFEPYISRCLSNYPNPTNCILSQVESCESNTAYYQQYFTKGFQTAACSAAEAIRAAFECSFGVENITLSAMSVVTTQINQCIWGQDSCNQFSKTYSCPEVYNINQADISKSDKTMPNPVFGRELKSDCLMLGIN